MSCTKSITTSSGTFSYSDTTMTRCEAKKYCRDEGKILAPITTQEDKDAVMKLLDYKCSKFHMYHIGLDVHHCGSQQERVFTNGITYDSKTHGKLYDDLGEPKDKCPETFLMYFSSNPLKISANDPNCWPSHYRALCLDQTTAVSSPISQDNSEFVKLNLTQSLAMFGGIFCAFVGVFGFAIKMYKRSKHFETKLYELEK